MTPRDRLRAILRRHAAGVVVVTAYDDAGEPVGLTVSSFTPVSLQPPLVAFFVGDRASVRSVFETAPGFTVNVLGGDQAALATHFATSGIDRFAGLAWTPGPGGWPRLPGALSWLACAAEIRQPAGDHLLLIGRIEHAEAGPAGHPLVHHAGELLPLSLPVAA